MKRIFDGLIKKYREVEVSNGYYTENGEQLYRIVTKGKTGKKLYRNEYYINDGKEQPVYGMGGPTGHGWGGKVMGYILKSEFAQFGIK